MCGELARDWSCVQRPVRSKAPRTARRWWCRTAARSCPSAYARSSSPTGYAGCRTVVEKPQATRKLECSRRHYPRTRNQRAPPSRYMLPASPEWAHNPLNIFIYQNCEHCAKRVESQLTCVQEVVSRPRTWRQGCRCGSRSGRTIPSRSRRHQWRAEASSIAVRRSRISTKCAAAAVREWRAKRRRTPAARITVVAGALCGWRLAPRARRRCPRRSCRSVRPYRRRARTCERCRSKRVSNSWRRRKQRALCGLLRCSFPIEFIGKESVTLKLFALSDKVLFHYVNDGFII